MTALDLCAVCVAALWPGQQALKQAIGSYGYGYTQYAAVRVPGQPSHTGRPTVEELEAGAVVDAPGGVTLPMRAVTTVDGTRVCHVHAGDAWEMSGQRPKVYR